MEREYVHSGSQWIGEIPAEWSTIPIKRTLLSRDGGSWGNEPGEDEIDAICMRIADFDYSKGVFRRNDEDAYTVRSYSKNQFTRLKLKQGDILIEKSGGGEKTPVGRTVQFNLPYTALFANFMDRLRFKADTVTPDYAEYFFRALYYKAVSVMYIKQTIGIQNLNLTDLLAEEKIIQMPIEEQNKIVRYLDDLCADIDTAIDEAKASILDYKAYKQSKTAELATKGLDPNAPMKDSGIAWLGKIPSDWELKRLKYILFERNERNNPVKTEERLSLSIDKGVTLYAEKTTNLDRFKDDFTQYKLAHEGDLVMNSMNMIVGASGVSKYFGCVSPAYYTFYDKEEDHVTAKYYEILFRNRLLMRVFRSMGKGIYSIDRGDDKVNTCRLKVPRDDLRSMYLPYPPLAAQRQIVSVLKEHCDELDSLVAEKESIIDELETYKKSVIFETVTGKRKVGIL